MPTISCPTCGKMLNVPADLLGKKVKCSACQGIFTAEAESAPAPPPPPPREEEAERPSQRREPARRAADEEEEEDRPRRRRRDEDDLDEDRPRRRRYKEHRGTLILVMGILGLLVCGPLGIAAWVMGNGDMREIRAGRMDPEGEGTTNVGRILGMVSTIMMILGVCL